MPASVLAPQIIAGAYKCYVGGDVTVPNPYAGIITVNTLGTFVGDTENGVAFRPNGERIQVTGDFYGNTAVATIDAGCNPTLEMSALEWTLTTDQFLWPRFAASGTDWNAQVTGALATTGRMQDDLAYSLILVPVRGSRAALQDLGVGGGKPLWVFPKVWPRRDNSEAVFSATRDRKAPVTFSVFPCQGTVVSASTTDIDMAVFYGRAAMP